MHVRGSSSRIRRTNGNVPRRATLSAPGLIVLFIIPATQTSSLIEAGILHLIICGYQVSDGYKLLRTIDLRKFHHYQLDDTWIAYVSFISADLVMVTAGYGGIFFLSPLLGQCVAICPLKNSVRATVLSDGRVFVCGMHGYCTIFKPPKEVEVSIAEYNQRIVMDGRRIPDVDEES